MYEPLKGCFIREDDPHNGDQGTMARLAYIVIFSSWTKRRNLTKQQ